ncbi:MAG: efflux RND transporter permease subunit, partial [Candidatus Wallbacteria bacterium]|nr:efflux RND transporter permease subunit [Candidatus Wallbacteria bacterium]
MSLSDLCIQRPVFATMLVAALLVLGAFSYKDLGVDLFPKVDLPNIVVTTRFAGAGPEEVETQITKVIEEAVNTISGIDELRSSSFEGISQVVVVFKLNRDPSDCAQDVRDRVGRILAKLPDGVEPPIIEKFDPDAAPVISVVVASPWPHKELTEFAKKRIKESIESVPGVGQVNMVGGREREVHVNLDSDRLRALGVTPHDVKEALKRQNLEVPGGLVETGPRDMVLRTIGRVGRVEDFRKVVVKEVGGTLIRMEDLAAVTDAEQEQRTMARLDGTNAVALIVQKQSGTNTVQVVAAVKQRLEELKAIVPSEVKLETVRDQSRFILAAFHAVMEHLILGALLASLVVYLFLGNMRSTLIAAVAIPTSVISTFTLMRFYDFTLNQMSLLALALAVGLVIDDAIVVLENIFRHIDERGSTPMAAASEATREIALAVMATTLSLVVIFLPVAFMPGIIGRFFKAFGLTMTFSILVSMLVSFTLTPMMCSRFLRRKGEGKGHGGSGGLDWFHSRIQSAYLALLGRSLKHRFVVVIAAGLCIVSTVPILKIVGKDFIPFDDQSEFLINIKAPEGTSIQSTGKILSDIERRLRGLGNVEKV